LGRIPSKRGRKQQQQKIGREERIYVFATKRQRRGMQLNEISGVGGQTEEGEGERTVIDRGTLCLSGCCVLLPSELRIPEQEVKPIFVWYLFVRWWFH